MEASKPVSIDAYLSRIPTAQRPALTNLREQIKRLYPDATEHISYSKPLFKLDGHPLAGLYAAKHHLAMFVWSDTALGALGGLLRDYDITESTIRFAPDKPLPQHVVKAVLQARAKEIRDRWGHK